MRGERPAYTAATIVDKEGATRYHIIPNRLIIFGLATMALLVMTALILGFLIIHNKYEIDTLRQKIEAPVEDTNDAR